MFEREYKLADNELAAMRALADFIDNALAGYGGEAGKIEERMATHISWVCEDFFRLIVASAERQFEYEDKQRQQQA